MKKIFTLVIFVFLLCSCSKSYISNNIKDYNSWIEKDSFAEEALPKLTDIGNYSSIKFTHKTPNDPFISTTTTIAIFASYDSENYEKEKDRIFEKYLFFEETNEYFESISAEVNGYDFKIVEQIKNNEMYTIKISRCFLVIGYNDESNIVAYLYFWDDSAAGTRNLQKSIEKKLFFDF